MKELNLKQSRNILLYLLLPVGLYIFMVIVPTFISFYYSLFNWSGGTDMDFTGFSNYIDLIKDLEFWHSFKNTMVFTVLMVLGQVGIAFLFTLFFYHGLGEI